MHNLIEYSDNSLKTSESLWQYYRHEPNDNLYSDSFKSKVKSTRNTPDNGNIKDGEIMLLLKYISNFWRALEMPLINCEVNLTWSSASVITNSAGAGRFAIIDTKRYVPVVTSATQDNTKLFQQLKSRFKRTINWKKCQSDPKRYAQNRYTQGVNRLFVLSFEKEDDRRSLSNYDLPE